MFRPEQLRQLADFHSDDFPLTTFYWKALPAANRVHHEDLTLAHNLLREGCQRIRWEDYSREQRRSAEADQARILDFLRNAPEGTWGSLALFACSGESFWQAIRLPRGVRSGLFMGSHFYVQPLSVLLDQYHRYCTVLVDRHQARLFEVYMEEIEEHAAFLDDVPGRIKAATWTGGNERQIERRGENKAQQHYKRTAAMVLRLFKKYSFDWLILGGHREGLAAFENHLHSYLRPRLIGAFSADVNTAALPEILAKSMRVAEARDRQEKGSLVEEVVNKAHHGGLGVLGLADTLRALQWGGVHTLVVDNGLDVSAGFCRQCGSVPSAEARLCPHCQAPVERLQDAVEEAVERAIQDNSQICFVNGNHPLREAGSIGALLRFRPREAAAAPTQGVP